MDTEAVASGTSETSKDGGGDAPSHSGFLQAPPFLLAEHSWHHTPRRRKKLISRLGSKICLFWLLHEARVRVSVQGNAGHSSPIEKNEALALTMGREPIQLLK